MRVCVFVLTKFFKYQPPTCRPATSPTHTHTHTHTRTHIRKAIATMKLTPHNLQSFKALKKCTKYASKRRFSVRPAQLIQQVAVAGVLCFLDIVHHMPLAQPPTTYLRTYLHMCWCVYVFARFAFIVLNVFVHCYCCCCCCSAWPACSLIVWQCQPHCNSHRTHTCAHTSVYVCIYVYVLHKSTMHSHIQ